MSWRIRHQGSPREVHNLTVAEVVEGLQDGLWEASDEVMGPRDATWLAIEDHAQFADIVQELEPLPASTAEDETRLDMNALIDVTLVLLIFFILTLSYQTLEKVMEMPKNKGGETDGVKAVAQERVENFMILVKASREGDQPVIWVEGERVAEDQLQTVLKRVARETKRSELLLDAAGVDYGTVIKIIDAAGGAKIEQVHFLDRRG